MRIVSSFLALVYFGFAAAVVISGTTGVTEAGQSVTVEVGGLTYSTVVASDGSWSATIPASALAQLADGSQPLSVSITDSAGDMESTTHQITIDNGKLMPLPFGPMSEA